jgi:hypothetical protein
MRRIIKHSFIHATRKTDKMKISFKVADPLLVEFDVQSLDELLALIQKEGGAIDAIRAHFADTGSTDAPEGATGPGGTPGKRPRRSKAEMAAAAAAQAPDPLPVPAAPPAAPVPAAPALAVAGTEPGIPAFLQRPLPPLAGPAPSLAPPPPPPATATLGNRLSDKVIAELKKKREGYSDNGQSLADWVASTGLMAKGATFDEVEAVLQFQDDDKLKPLAAALGIAA